MSSRLQLHIVCFIIYYMVLLTLMQVPSLTPLTVILSVVVAIH